MRILVLNWLDRENPQAGGAEEHLHRTFGRLARSGHDVTALVSGWPGCAPRAELDGIEVHRTGTRHTFSLAAPRYWRRTLADGGFDVVVEDLNKVPLFTPYWIEPPILLLAHHLFGLTAFRAASPPVAAATWLLERPIPVVYRGVPVVAVSESTRDDLVARGLRPGDVAVIPNGVDIARYRPDPSVPKSVRPTLLFLGRLKQYKRVDLLLAAVRVLAARGVDVELLVAGAGDRSEALQAEAVRLGLQERVRFLGYVPDDRKLELLRSAWIHVLTSEKEGWGITNVEAGACGTPSVASDAPGLRESVVDGETGLLVPHGDVDALVDALSGLIGDPAARERMGEAARRFAERFGWDRTAEAFEDRLGRVVAASAAR